MTNDEVRNKHETKSGRLKPVGDFPGNIAGKGGGDRHAKKSGNRG
jgi:hypothetical protein